VSESFRDAACRIGLAQLTDQQRLERLDLSRHERFDVVIDTDTYNEVDDQFALAYALRAPGRIHVEACYAAPYHNHRSTGPAEGMELSYREIHRVLSLVGGAFTGPVRRGATAFLGERGPMPSDAARDLVERAMRPRERPLHVLAIAALTNIADAILLEPRIAGRIVVIWLGGHPGYWFHTREFNLRQDIAAARVVLDGGVPLLRVPCANVAEHLRTTPAELREHLADAGELGAYLYQSVADYVGPRPGDSKVIWDAAPVALLVNPDWVRSTVVSSPIVTPMETWSRDPRRHLGREAYSVNRDEIFHDLFRRLRVAAPRPTCATVDGTH